MKRYEVVAIVKADLADDDLTAIIERSQTIITDRKGIIAKVDKWGKRRLAYEINKQKDGFYFLIDFAGDGPIVAEIERNFKIDDRILKFMTVKKEGAVTREGMEQETAVVETKRTQIRIETNPPPRQTIVPPSRGIELPGRNIPSACRQKNLQQRRTTYEGGINNGRT